MQSILLGFDAMVFVTAAVMLSIWCPMSLALMPIMVMMQLASAAETRSVGEKACPRPWLSIGASVITS